HLSCPFFLRFFCQPISGQDMYDIPSTDSKFNGSVARPAAPRMYAYGGGLVNGSWRNLFYTDATDGGSNWQPSAQVLGGSNVFVNDLKVINDSYMIAAASNGIIYKYDGVNWANAINVGAPAYSIALNQNQSQVVYACGSNGLVKTTNAGVNWNSRRSGALKCVVVQPNNSNYVATLSSDGNNIYYSVDGASSWNVQNVDISKPISNIGFDVSSATLYAATISGLHKLTAPNSSPTLITPNNNETVSLNKSFTWDSVAGASGYQFIIDDNQDFSSPSVNATNVSGTNYRCWNLISGRLYWWKVSAHNAAGQTIFSETRVCNVVANGNITLNLRYAFVGNVIYPRLWWTADAQNTPPFGIYRYVCNYPGTDCGNEPYPLLAITNNYEYIDYEVIVADKGSNPACRYYYQIRSAGISNKVGVLSCGSLGGGIEKASPIAENPLPTETKLGQSYPNPFNPITVIKYDLSEDVHVTIKIYDILGREVVTLVDEFQEAGFKSVSFDASVSGGLPSGIYFYRMTAGHPSTGSTSSPQAISGQWYTDIKKMILLR
ncbi:MAG: T9SS type A sorting domain-containing protein, partial [Bacteroidota bacterium]|nr:T9SS type A sorting domain-containing protein [Bacteroidota bacterium]